MPKEIKDINEIKKIQSLVILSLFSVDELMDKFVLKGGNALNLIYEVNNRSSIDIDVSIESEFTNLEEIKNLLEKSLDDTFSRENYRVIDVHFTEQPENIDPQYKDFWGGYKLEFKIVKEDDHKKISDFERLKRNSIIVNGKGKFKVDISKHEYCQGKVDFVFQGQYVYVYTPLMIVYEKLRAICQQTDEYSEIVKTNKKPRARDFFDICSLINVFSQLSKEIFFPENLESLKKIFSIKKVPTLLLSKIENYKSFHRENFHSVISTVSSEDIKDYDFYFDHVVGICNQISRLL